MNIEFELKLFKTKRKKGNEKRFKKVLKILIKLLSFAGYRVEVISAICYD